MNLLEIKGIGIQFGGLKAVQNFNLDLPPRALYGLIGPNGAGKTTVFNLMTGVYCPSSGSIHLAGERVDRKKPHQIAYAGLARTFQNVRRFGEMSVLDNVRMGCPLRGKHSLHATVLRSGAYRRQEDKILRRARELLEVFH